MADHSPDLVLSRAYSDPTHAMIGQPMAGDGKVIREETKTDLEKCPTADVVI